MLNNAMFSIYLDLVDYLTQLNGLFDYAVNQED